MRTIASLAALVSLTLSLGVSPPVAAQTEPAATAPAPADYAKAENWVCWPGATPNACDVDLSTTVIAPDGSTAKEAYKADPKAPIDCFYVYPTVSIDPGVLANLAVEPAERQVVKQQFARFGASCRLYAPVYRQFTLTALVANMSGHPLPGSGPAVRVTGYNDVKDAWNYYLAHENHGRGVVLIGHSQGSGVLTQLIKNEIDGKPVQGKIISAILMGTSLAVPATADVGGDFKSMPLCHSATQSGCAIAFASFREESPPPANSLFGKPRTPGPGLVAACVNPANLGGGEGALHSYLPAGSESIAPNGQAQRPWVAGKTLDTPFVSVPGMLTARCATTDGFNYLSIHVNKATGGARANDLPGDVVIGGVVQKNWGLHLIDANLTMGNLVDLVRVQGAAWMVRNP